MVKEVILRLVCLVGHWLVPPLIRAAVFQPEGGSAHIRRNVLDDLNDLLSVLLAYLDPLFLVVVSQCSLEQGVFYLSINDILALF